MIRSRFPISVLGCFVAISSLATAQQAVQPLMGAPLPGLSAQELDRFHRGKEMFNHIFADAEGVGPIMNRYGFSGRCMGCHLSPVPGGGTSVAVTRFGVAASGSSPFDPLLALGGPVRQTQALFTGCFESVPSQANVVSQRITPPLFGLGLVDAVADADIQVREVFPPPGVSGRANLVVPVETPLGPLRVGRFGWKSQVATLLTFSADALVTEHGITNRLFPNDPVPNGPAGSPHACNDPVPDPEDVSDAQGFQKIDRLSDFVRFLAPPPRTPKSGMSGEPIFDAIGCTKCHVSTPFVTMPTLADAGLQNRALQPYSDFLLHDVGTGDNFPDGLATGAEMRTPPLWGLAFRIGSGLMHDASAFSASPEQTIEAAIFAHGGEASSVVAAYSNLSAVDRQRVQRFLMSLGHAEFDYDSNTYDNQVTHMDWYFISLDVTGPGSFFDADDRRAIADFDQDGDIDLRDIAGFQRAFTGDIPLF